MYYHLYVFCVPHLAGKPVEYCRVYLENRADDQNSATQKFNFTCMHCVVTAIAVTR